MRPVRPLVALIALVGMATSSRADVLCTTGSGALRARPACKRREKPVDLPALGPVGAPGARGDAGAPGPTVQIVDATGQKFGEKVFVAEGRPSLFMIGEVPVVFSAGGGGFIPMANFNYESADCAGTRLMFSSVRPLIRFGEVLGTTGHYPGDPVESHAITSISYVSTPGDCASNGGTFSAGACCVNLASPQTMTAGPAVSVDMSAIVARFPAGPRPVP